MKLWDLRTNKVLKQFTKHSFDVVAVEFVGDSCVSASKDGTTGVWHFSSEESGDLLSIPNANLITSLKILENHNDKITIAVCSFDGSISFVEIFLNDATDPILKNIYATPATA